MGTSAYRCYRARRPHYKENRERSPEDLLHIRPGHCHFHLIVCTETCSNSNSRRGKSEVFNLIKPYPVFCWCWHCHCCCCPWCFHQYSLFYCRCCCCLSFCCPCVRTPTCASRDKSNSVFLFNYTRGESSLFSKDQLFQILLCSCTPAYAQTSS